MAATQRAAPQPGQEQEADKPARFGGRAADAGMATVEYAIATLAAAGFAGLLLLVLRSDSVRETLANLVQQALSL